MHLLFGLALAVVVTLVSPKKEPMENEKKTDTVESKAKVCVRPTRDNPFGNNLLTDPADRAAACTYEDVKDEQRTAFNVGLMRNMTDVYEQANSQRQFMTLPVTTKIADTQAFAQFAYGTGSTCKENAMKCTGYN